MKQVILETGWLKSKRIYERNSMINLEELMQELAHGHFKYKGQMPDREMTYGVYDLLIDLEYNPDFALWEMEIKNK